MKNRWVYHLSVLFILALSLMLLSSTPAVADGHCIDGDDSNNFLYGTRGDDCIHGKSGDDILDGGAGNDFMGGGRDNDILSGGLGNDEMRGGPGMDAVYGGRGNDTLYGCGSSPRFPGVCADGQVDFVDGGAGHDVCYVERIDVVVNCEDIRY